MLLVSWMIGCASGFLLCLYAILIGFSGARKEAQEWISLLIWRGKRIVRSHQEILVQAMEQEYMNLECSNPAFWQHSLDRFVRIGIEQEHYHPSEMKYAREWIEARLEKIREIAVREWESRK